MGVPQDSWSTPWSKIDWNPIISVPDISLTVSKQVESAKKNKKHNKKRSGYSPACPI